MVAWSKIPREDPLVCISSFLFIDFVVVYDVCIYVFHMVVVDVCICVYLMGVFWDVYVVLRSPPRLTPGCLFDLVCSLSSIRARQPEAGLDSSVLLRPIVGLLSARFASLTRLFFEIKFSDRNIYS